VRNTWPSQCMTAARGILASAPTYYKVVGTGILCRFGMLGRPCILLCLVGHTEFCNNPTDNPRNRLHELMRVSTEVRTFIQYPLASLKCPRTALTRFSRPYIGVESCDHNYL
jgi:hypothetical protein